MPSIGDIANDVARTLYEQRILVAIVSVAAIVGAILVARRLGWFAAARRHPARTVALTVAVVVVVAPVTWYLASPLVIRTSLVEAAPTLAPSVAPTASAAASTAPSAAPTDEPSPSAATPSPTVAAPVEVASGMFVGTDDFHFGRGTASILALAEDMAHVRLEDFSVRNGPDLYVVLSPSPESYVEGSLEVGLLKATDGSFGYDLPPGTDLSAYRSVLIWCKQFSHLFAYATLDA